MWPSSRSSRTNERWREGRGGTFGLGFVDLLSEVILGTIPFHLVMFLVLALVILWPDLALWLPHQMSR